MAYGRQRQPYVSPRDQQRNRDAEQDRVLNDEHKHAQAERDAVAMARFACKPLLVKWKGVNEQVWLASTAANGDIMVRSPLGGPDARRLMPAELVPAASAFTQENFDTELGEAWTRFLAERRAFEQESHEAYQKRLVDDQAKRDREADRFRAAD